MRGCISRRQQARRDAASVWFQRRPEPGMRQCRQPGYRRRAARGIHAWRGSTGIVALPIDVPMVGSPINMLSAAWPITTPVAHRSPPCNLCKAQYPHAARPRRRATGSRRPGPDQTPNGQPGAIPCAVDRPNAISNSCSRCTPAWSARADRASARPARPAVAGSAIPLIAARPPISGGRPPHQRACTYAAHSAGNASPVRCSHSAGVYRPSRNAASSAFTRPGSRASLHFRNAPVTR